MFLKLSNGHWINTDLIATIYHDTCEPRVNVAFGQRGYDSNYYGADVNTILEWIKTQEDADHAAKRR